MSSALALRTTMLGLLKARRNRAARGKWRSRNTLKIIGGQARPEIDVDDFNILNTSRRRIAVRSYTTLGQIQIAYNSS